MCIRDRTKSGKIFYLIIDNSKSQDNVYFLTEVSEKDLMNFTPVSYTHLDVYKRQELHRNITVL